MTNKEAADQFALARLRNITGAGEGSNLPPRMQGSRFRVPFATNFRVVQSSQSLGNSQFTLAWDEAPNPNIDHYTIFAVANQTPLGSFTSPRSPAQISIPTTSVNRVTFTIQTVLSNGLFSDLNNSPSCTGVTSSSDNSISISTLPMGTPGQLITWDSGGNPVTFGPGANNSILTGKGTGLTPAFNSIGTLNLVLGNTNLTTANGLTYVASSGTVSEIATGTSGYLLQSNGAGSPPSWSSTASLDLVLGNSNLSTVGSVPYVSVAGTLNQDANLVWDSTNHRLGIQRSSPTVALDVGNSAAALQMRVTGIIKFAGTNSTGGGSALLGANSPASTLTAPYTWITVQSSDGSTVFIPAWK